MSFCILNQQNMLSVVNMGSVLHSVTLLSPIRTIMCAYKSSVSSPNYLLRASGNSRYIVKHLSCLAASEQSDANPDSNPSHNSKSKPKRKTRRRTSKEPNSESKSLDMSFPGMIPKKPRRGRRGEAAAVEDFVRDRLEQTLETIKKQNPEILENMENFMKERFDGNASLDDDISDEEEDDDKNENSASGGKRVLIEEDDPDWPLDADIGWGIRASEYFDKHSIKNVVGEDGTNIDWEGEIDYGLVKEINCLEWESFAFHPSPLIVLVFERYNRASDNWRVLKELEKAAEVYWKAKDRLPPRTVKIDVNIERDLAYALKVRDCPQILFLRGNKILYREKESRSADELVQMIAHFYYNAKKPSCINDAFLSSHQ